MRGTIRIGEYNPGRVRNIAPAHERRYAGRLYHSKAELVQAQELDILKAAGKIQEWVPQVPFTIRVNCVKICKVVVDFMVVEKNGHVYHLEVKGWETPEYKLKAKLLKACYPDIDYRVVKVRL